MIVKNLDQAEEVKKKEALEVQTKLEENQIKKKTSVHVEGAETVAVAIGDYTVEQLISMSDREFTKVPKKVREEFLKKYNV